MHKEFWIAILGIMAMNSAVAAEHPRPKTLNCVAPRANAQARKFAISKFDTDRPTADNEAFDSGGVTVDNLITSLCANNGCDNSYCYVFFTDDVTALANGKAKSIHGLMNYLNSASKDGQELADTVSLYCSAGK